MGKHALARRVVVGNYVRKPRMRFLAIAIVSRLWVERVGRVPYGATFEPFPTTKTITRHAVMRGEESTMVLVDRERGR